MENLWYVNCEAGSHTCRFRSAMMGGIKEEEHFKVATARVRYSLEGPYEETQQIDFKLIIIFLFKILNAEYIITSD